MCFTTTFQLPKQTITSKIKSGFSQPLSLFLDKALTVAWAGLEPNYVDQAGSWTHDIIWLQLSKHWGCWEQPACMALAFFRVLFLSRMPGLCSFLLSKAPRYITLTVSLLSWSQHLPVAVKRTLWAFMCISCNGRMVSLEWHARSCGRLIWIFLRWDYSFSEGVLLTFHSH